MITCISKDGTHLECWSAEDELIGYILKDVTGFTFVSTDASVTVYPVRPVPTMAIADAQWHDAMVRMTA